MGVGEWVGVCMDQEYHSSKKSIQYSETMSVCVLGLAI